MKISLVIMAAGLGSRYGGSKQVDGIGPNGEILMEYSIYDASGPASTRWCSSSSRRWSHDAPPVRRRPGPAHRCDGSPVEVAYAFQDFSSVPDFYHIPPERTKPFGTVHALLCAADKVHELLRHQRRRLLWDRCLPHHLPGADQAAAGGEGHHGGLSAEEHRQPPRHRLPWRVHGGERELRSIREALKIQLYPDGSLKDLAEDRSLEPETVVSMNFWGFSPCVFPALKAYFENFLRYEAGDNIKAECLLPLMVGSSWRRGLGGLRPPLR